METDFHDFVILRYASTPKIERMGKYLMFHIKTSNLHCDKNNFLIGRIDQIEKKNDSSGNGGGCENTSKNSGTSNSTNGTSSGSGSGTAATPTAAPANKGHVKSASVSSAGGNNGSQQGSATSADQPTLGSLHNVDPLKPR